MGNTSKYVAGETGSIDVRNFGFPNPFTAVYLIDIAFVHLVSLLHYSSIELLNP